MKDKPEQLQIPFPDEPISKWADITHREFDELAREVDKRVKECNQSNQSNQSK